MRRTWTAIVTIAGALAGAACHRTEPGPTPPPAQSPPPAPAPSDNELPPRIKPRRVCNSPFAIVETDRPTCDLGDAATMWKLVPPRPSRNQVSPGKGDKRYVKPPAPTEPRRGSSKSRPFCVYEWTGDRK